MNIQITFKHNGVPAVFSIPELFEYALEDPGHDEQTTARNNSLAHGRLCEVLADKLQLTAEEVLYISGADSDCANPKFC